ncbi:MAG: hypothetical protein IJZ89_03730 [Clostridia bacterium]|nr:hypothetical protein [Clostridia bacterium]
MKKLIAWILLSVLLISCLLTGCTDPDNDNDFEVGDNDIEADDIFGVGGEDTLPSSDTEAESIESVLD